MSENRACFENATASRRTFLQASLAGLAALAARPVLGAPKTAAGGKLLGTPGSRTKTHFTFFHISDSHIEPRLEGAAYNAQGRSVQALRWIAESTGRKIRQEKYDVEAEPPRFAIHTGDVFEYSVIDETWGDFERAIARFRCPIAPVPGNHDNTWGEINRELRERFGDENYSFDYGNCHFICLNSAGLLDPLPAWDRRTLTWLAEDLSDVDHETPVLMAFHHPLSGEAGYASQYDRLRLWDVIQDHNIVLMMDGHWHTVHHQQWQGIDRVNGGATFGVHTGYNAVTVRDGVLRVSFNYWQENAARPKERDQVPLLEKKLNGDSGKRPFTVKPIAAHEVAHGKAIKPRVELQPGANVKATAWLDDRQKTAKELLQDDARLTGRLGTGKLTPGWHYITVRVQPASGAAVDFAESFWLNPPADAPFELHRYQAAAGIKTQPVVLGERVFVGDTGGVVTALSLDLQPAWKYSTGSQIVHSLAAAGDLLLVGDVDGAVHALRPASGERVWRRKLPNAIYAAADCSDGLALFGDAAGWMHALRIASGQVAWSRKVAAHGFEARPLVHGDLVLTGAWDARLYAVRHATGDVAWKAWCPTWHKDHKSRYYAPADTSPVVLGEHVLITDRGYRLGRYSLGGEYIGLLREQVAAIGANGSDGALYTRGLDHQLVKLAADGSELWKHRTPLGRAPTAPVVCGNRVAVVSDTGLLCVADDSTGSEMFSLSLSPSLFVLSGLGTDGKDHLFAADMDGRLTAVRISG